MCKNECIIDSGNHLNNIVSRMEEEISLRKDIFGMKIPFSLETDATKVLKLLEISQRHKSIIGGEHPH